MSTSRYPQPRVVRMTWSDAVSLTVLETARACATAGVSDRDAQRLMRAIVSGQGSPEEIEAGTLLYYAIAWQLERRIDPAVSWEQAQTWRVELDAAVRDPIVEAEAHAAVSAALETGLPPDVAGELTAAQMGAYRSIRSEQAKAAKAAARGHRRGYRRTA